MSRIMVVVTADVDAVANAKGNRRRKEMSRAQFISCTSLVKQPVTPHHDAIPMTCVDPCAMKFSTGARHIPLSIWDVRLAVVHINDTPRVQFEI